MFKRIINHQRKRWVFDLMQKTFMCSQYLSIVWMPIMKGCTSGLGGQQNLQRVWALSGVPSLEVKWYSGLTALPWVITVRNSSMHMCTHTYTCIQTHKEKKRQKQSLDFSLISCLFFCPGSLQDSQRAKSKLSVKVLNHLSECQWKDNPHSHYAFTCMYLISVKKKKFLHNMANLHEQKPCFSER